MNLFPLPISLHQGDSGATLPWKNIPGNCRYVHFLPVVPIKMKFKKGRNNEDGMQLGLFQNPPPHFTQIHWMIKTQRSKECDSMEPTALHLHTSPSTTKLSGDTQGGVPDTGCQPLDAIHCLPESFPPRCGDHTSSPSSSRSFVNLPDLLSRA